MDEHSNRPRCLEFARLEVCAATRTAGVASPLKEFMRFASVLLDAPAEQVGLAKVVAPLGAPLVARLLVQFQSALGIPRDSFPTKKEGSPTGTGPRATCVARLRVEFDRTLDVFGDVLAAY